jgi:polyisoprenoid-binding protein YceI
LKTRSTLIALAFALSAGTVQAAPQTYALDTSHTFANFSYDHLGYSRQVSRFNKTSGKVTLDKEARNGSVQVTIDTQSVNTGSDLFNQHIQGEDFLNTAKFPTATFTSTKVHFNGDTPTSVEGNLTIKGVTQPVTFVIDRFLNRPHPMLKKDAIGANATAQIKRSEFNAGKLVPYVGDDVTLSISLEALAE